jgi:hypothetical protein
VVSRERRFDERSVNDGGRVTLPELEPDGLTSAAIVRGTVGTGTPSERPRATF